MLAGGEGKDLLPAMVQHVVKRCGDLESALTSSTQWSEWKRYEARAEGDYRDRLSAEPENPRTLTIFDERNASLRPVATVGAFLEARLSRDYFSSTPWFAVKPQGPLDGPLAKQLEPYARYKLREAKFEEFGRGAIKSVLDMGFCPVKVTYDVQTDESEEFKIVLVDTTTGMPVVDQDGNMIEESRAWQETEVPVIDAATGQPLMEEPSQVESDAPLQQDASLGGDNPGLAPGANFLRPAGASADAPVAELSTLNSQPSTQAAARPVMRPATIFEGGVEFLPQQHEWREMIVPKTVRIFSGLRIEQCEWKGVLYPIDAPSFEEADLVAVESNMKLSALRKMVQGKKREPNEPLPPGELPFSEEIEALLEELATVRQNTPEGEHGEPRTGESAVVSPDGDPFVKVTEAYGQYDCLEDGVMRRYWMILVRDRNMCLWVDYRSALNPRCRKPVFMLALNKARNRCYGMGLYELYESLENLTDEQLNVILRGNEWVARPPVFVNRKRLSKSQQNANDEVIYPGAELNPDDGTLTPDQIVKPIQWPDKLERAWQLMQLPMQIIQAWSGVTNAAQAAVSNLPGNELATGINALTEVASIMHVHTLMQLKPGFEEILSYAIETVFWRQDQNETYEYLEGNAAAVMALADAEVLRKLPLNVEITLTRAKRQEDREMAIAAIPLAQQFYTLPATIQLRLLKMYLKALTGIGFDNPEEFFPTVEEIMAQIQAEADAAATKGQGGKGPGGAGAGGTPGA